MKALRYILSLMAILSVMGMSAATYGTHHQPQYRRVVYRQAEIRADMPVATMMPVNSVVMQSGTTLPLAAATGVSVAEDSPTFNKGPRRMKMVGEDDGFENEDDPDVPINPFPLGDGIVPMILMAMLFAGGVYYRRRRLRKE